MTSSTLRRRLEAGGTSYQNIKDEARRERAIEHLQLNRKSNAEIAEELGFGDPSTFYRAFRKWTGATPNAFRRQVRNPG
jgi:AraC-like DNA-binding protein